MCHEPHHCIFNHVMLFRDKHVCLGGIQTMPSLLYRYITINSTKKNIIYKEINRLWVSCVSRRGCLNDSDSDVFANLECICTNKKIFDWERKRKKAPRRWAHLPWSDTSLVSDLCLYARRCVWFDHIFLHHCLKQLRLKFTKPSLFWDVDDIKCIAEFLWLISAAVTRIRSGDDILTWQHALQTPRIPRAATRRCLSLPSICRTPGNTDCKTRITLTSRGRPQSTEGRCICTSAATGIFNMQG